MAANSADTSVSASVQVLIRTYQKDLYYPSTVERFYKQVGYRLAWIAPDTIRTHASEGMLLLDCVLQYGLNHSDYHPQELLYSKLRDLTTYYGKARNMEKARFDIMLTDAVIAFINHLHYGRLNPDYAESLIDGGDINSFSAETVLADALLQKDFMGTVLSVQRKSKEYTDLQDHMRLLAGQYLDDCYEVPEHDIKIMAINMERLRWAEVGGDTYIHINIPSYTLKFRQMDTTYQFKVIVGKPDTPTPSLQSAITFFTTSPEWRVPQKILVRELLPKAIKNNTYLENSHLTIYNSDGKYVEPNKARLRQILKNPDGYYVTQSSGCDNSLGLIVFRFKNVFDIYLHDTPEQNLFAKQQRDFSHGCVRVEQAEKLAGLLLKYDGAATKIPAMHKAIASRQTKNFSLKKAVPIKITYLTCEMQQGTLITYPDIYNLDRRLEMALYHMAQPLTMH
jgi:L,D-transpeptidase YcbB